VHEALGKVAPGLPLFDVVFLRVQPGRTERRSRPFEEAIAQGEQPEDVPADIAESWRAADKRRRELIAVMRGPLYVSTKAEPMELRKQRLKKPGPPR